MLIMIAPNDIRAACVQIRYLLPDLDGSICHDALIDWLEDVKDARESDEDEIDWQYLRDECDEILAEDGYPPIFDNNE